MKSTITQKQAASINVVRVVTVTALILLIPLIAMQFTQEVKWSAFDFAVMGTLLFVTGCIFEAAMLRTRTSGRRLAAGVAIAVLFMYIWAELAVGIFTNLGS